ncbi:hypothetical protein SprV_0501808400 [Sparganum proliferum]
MAVTLHWSDYFIFALSLLAYALVGLYFRWSTQVNNLFNRCLGRPIKEVKPQTTQEIFLANRKLGVLPVMASTIASFLSAATILGNHLEVYLYGLSLMCNLLAQLAIHPIVSEIYMPVLYKLQLFSINQYFEMRFGVVAKILATITFILQTVFYVGASLFAPAVALSAMTGANLLLTILGTGTLTTFYTAMLFYVGASLFAPAVALSAMTGANLLLTILGTGALTTFYTAMSFEIHYVKGFRQIYEGKVEVGLQFLTLLLQLTDGEDHVGCSTMTAEVPLAFQQESLVQMADETVEKNARKDLSGDIRQGDASVVVAELAVPFPVVGLDE